MWIKVSLSNEFSRSWGSMGDAHRIYYNPNSDVICTFKNKDITFQSLSKFMSGEYKAVMLYPVEKHDDINSLIKDYLPLDINKVIDEVSGQKKKTRKRVDKKAG